MFTEELIMMLNAFLFLSVAYGTVSASDKDEAYVSDVLQLLSLVGFEIR